MTLPRHGLRWAGISAVAILLAACASNGPEPVTPTSPAHSTDAPAVATPAASATPEPRALRYVAFGDSWPAGAHCGKCKTFANLWIPGLEAATGAMIKYQNFMGSHEPGAGGGGDSATLLKNLTTNEPVRAATSDADIILIATGGNELELIGDAIIDGTCGGSDEADCIRDLGARWDANFDAILAEIGALRAGKPTVIRLVTAANAFVSDLEDLVPPGYGAGNGALVFELLANAMCTAAERHGAVCVDVRPILNGPTMLTPVDENSAESFQKIADALIATGVGELNEP